MSSNPSSQPSLPLELVCQVIASLSASSPEELELLRSLSQTNRVLLSACRSVLFRSVKTARGREYFSYQTRFLTSTTTTSQPLAGYIKELTLRPSSVVPFFIYKRGFLYSDPAEYDHFTDSLPDWTVSYRTQLGKLFSFCYANIESLTLKLTREEREEVPDQLVTSILISEFKYTWGLFSTPGLRSLELDGLDYDYLTTLSETLPGAKLLEDGSAWDKATYYANFSRIKKLETHMDGIQHVSSSCKSTPDQLLWTLARLDETLPYPPSHYDVTNWGLEPEDSHRPVPLMCFFRRVGDVIPSLHLTSLSIARRRMTESDFALKDILSYLIGLEKLSLKEVYIDHTIESWFLIFKTCKRALGDLKTLELQRLGYTALGTCPQQKLKICAVYEEDRRELVSFWDQIRASREELLADDDDRNEMEDLDINDKKLFCRVHPESRRFIGAVRTGDIHPDFL